MIWKDIFKPNYAIIVEIIAMPDLKTNKMVRDTVAVTRLPFKRDYNMSFKDFANLLRQNNDKNLIIYGYYWTFRSIYGVGSGLKHNIDNACILKETN